MMISQSVLNAYQNLSKLPKSFPKLLPYYSLPFILLPLSSVSSSSGCYMQTNFNKKHTLTHIRQSLGNSSSLDLATRETHHTVAYCACTHPSGYDPFFPSISSWIFYLHPQGAFFFFRYRYRVVYYVSLHSHFPSWADFSFNSCLWPASSRGINHFSFYF